MDKNGQLSKKDIIAEQQTAGGLHIIPYKEDRVKAASYDVSPTIIAMSTKTGMLETVYRERKYPYKFYIYVKARDTVLCVTRESFSVPSYISGYVVSRVSKVAEGFGHVSTSIDPNWKGALLIALNNPSNKSIKVYVGSNYVEEAICFTLATALFHYLNTAIETSDSPYKGMRLDILKKHSYSRRRGVKAWFIKTIHPFRKKYTDFFFNYYETNMHSQEKWEDNIRDLCGLGSTKENEEKQLKHKDKVHLSDFIIVENFLMRLWRVIKRVWPVLWRLVLIAFTILVAFGLLPSEWQDAIKKILYTILHIN